MFSMQLYTGELPDFNFFVIFIQMIYKELLTLAQAYFGN